MLRYSFDHLKGMKSVQSKSVMHDNRLNYILNIIKLSEKQI